MKFRRPRKEAEMPLARNAVFYVIGAGFSGFRSMQHEEKLMSKFPSLGEKATVPDILKMSPQAGKALLELHEAIMRLPSAWTPGQRELIAAYVSGINRCQYCHGVHAQTTKAYEDIPGQAVDRMLDNLET